MTASTHASFADRSSPHPGVVEPAYLELYEAAMRAVGARIWPAELAGAEALPDHDRYLLVANHSGLGMVESLVLPQAWLRSVRDERGEARPLAAMAHSTLFRLPGFGTLLRAAGAVEATREGARYALTRGAPLLLFPGGDHEAMRPLWRAHEVDFAGRRGWIELARTHGLTIVPMAITGSHRTAPNLGYSRRLAWLGPRFVGMHRMPLPVLSIAAATAVLAGSRRPLASRVPLAAAAYLAGVFVPFVPSTIRFRVLPPLAIESLSDEEVYARVTGAISEALRRSKRRA